MEKYTLPVAHAEQPVSEVTVHNDVRCVRMGHPEHPVHTRLVEAVQAVVWYDTL